MWTSIVGRTLRRRVLGLTGLVVIFYSLYFFWEHNWSSLSFSEPSFQRTRPLIWRTLREHLLPDEASNRTNNMEDSCRNSIQGISLIVDDRGFVCQRANLLKTGCCDVEFPETLYYTCKSCNTTTTNCCGVYEYCVSCCLHPSRRPLLEKWLYAVSQSGRQAAVFSNVVDHFELCLVKCRTNSHSVEHENKYRDPKDKYCYGPTRAHESQRAVLENTS